MICNNVRTISFVSHPSKVILTVVLDRLEPLAEEIFAEEQAGLRTGKSTTEYIFNLIIICQNTFNARVDLFRVFIKGVDPDTKVGGGRIGV